MLLDRHAGLGNCLARHRHEAILPQVDRAVGSDQVLAGDRLGPSDAGQLHVGCRILEPLFQLLVQGGDDLIVGHARHADGAVRRPEVDLAFGLNHVVVVDGRDIRRGIGTDLEHVENSGPIGRQGDELEHFDLDDIRRLDAVIGQRLHGKFARRRFGGGV